MSEFKVRLAEGDISFSVDHLLTDEIRRTLVKMAIFDHYAMEGIAKMLVSGQIVWDDDESGNPWWTIWSGKGDTYEKARKAFVELAPEITQKLVSDLTAERDKLYAKCDEQRRELWESERMIRGLRERISELSKVPS